MTNRPHHRGAMALTTVALTAIAASSAQAAPVLQSFAFDQNTSASSIALNSPGGTVTPMPVPTFTGGFDALLDDLDGDGLPDSIQFVDGQIVLQDDDATEEPETFSADFGNGTGARLIDPVINLVSPGAPAAIDPDTGAFQQDGTSFQYGGDAEFGFFLFGFLITLFDIGLDEAIGEILVPFEGRVTVAGDDILIDFLLDQDFNLDTNPATGDFLDGVSVSVFASASTVAQPLPEFEPPEVEMPAPPALLSLAGGLLAMGALRLGRRR